MECKENTREKYIHCLRLTKFKTLKLKTPVLKTSVSLRVPELANLISSLILYEV